MKKKNQWYKWLFLSFSILINGFIIFHSCLNGEQSAAWSDFFSNIFAFIINSNHKENVKVIPVESVTLEEYQSYAYNFLDDYENNEIPLGCAKALQAKVIPENATNKDVIFISSNSSVALSKQGNIVYVQGNEMCDFTITAYANSDHSKQASYDYHIVDLKEPSNIEVEDNVQIIKGLTYQIHPTIINPTLADSDPLLTCRYYDINKVSYLSSNSSIARMDDNLPGVIHGETVGETTIKVGQGEKQKTINVEVIDAPFASNNDWEIAGNTTCYIRDLDYDRQNQQEPSQHNTPLSITFNGDEPTDKGFTWESSDSLKAYVDSNGVVRGYRQAGTVTIKATRNLDGSSKTIDIKVSPKQAEEMIINNEGELEAPFGKVSEIRYISFKPINTTDTSFTIMASNENVLINNLGSGFSVEGVKEGTTILTITSNSNPSLSKIINVKVIRRGVINDDTYDDFAGFVRKSLGHFSLFVVSGIFTSLFLMLQLKNRKWWVWLTLSLAIGASVALLSEAIQAIPILHRAGSLLDAFIDFLGFSMFVLGYLIYRLVIYIKNKKRLTK